MEYIVSAPERLDTARQGSPIALVQRCAGEIGNLIAPDSSERKTITVPPFPPFPPAKPSDFAGTDAQEGLSLIQLQGWGGQVVPVPSVIFSCSLTLCSMHFGWCLGCDFSDNCGLAAASFMVREKTEKLTNLM